MPLSHCRKVPIVRSACRAIRRVKPALISRIRPEKWEIHFMDTGCATAIRGEDVSSFGLSADYSALGHLLESFVFCELEKSLPFLSTRWELHHWRNAPREVDVVAEAPGRILALFEMKASMTVDWFDFRHVDWFLKDGPGQAYRGCGFVFYLGDQILSFGPGRLALPLSIFWSY
jgi:predicted AAA+ superfamily ATPase